MATKSYSKHKEFKEYSTSTKNVPYTEEQFDMLKTELIPKGSKLESITRNGGTGAGTREYHYEYKEEKHPSGKYDRKDMHTVEEYTIPPKKTTAPKNKESSSYFYEREERSLPAVTGTRTYNYESSSSNTPGYSKVRSSTVKKDLSHNVDELDSLLDDLQKDQERQLYKSGYTSDTAESSSFDYRRGTPVKAPSSGYSTLKRSETSQYSAPAPVVKQEVRQEMFREETHESRVVPSQISPALPLTVPAPVCTHCHHSSNTLSRSSTPMNKVTTTVKTYTYEVPAGADPAAVPLPLHADHQRTYVTNTENIRSTSSPVPASPALGCQYCSHCNSRVTHTNNINEYHTRHTTSTDNEHTNERIVYPAPVNETKHLSPLPLNGQPNHGPSTYKYSETSYSHSSTRDRSPPPFPRPHTPSPSTQQPPKKLDDLLADFPEARFPTQPDGVARRRIEVSHESSKSDEKKSLSPSSKNTAGPAVYYPPGHVPFQNKPESAAYQSSAMQGGGAYAAGRGMYEYESGAKSKEKHTEKKTAVPVCLPLCCAMPCVIM